MAAQIPELAWVAIARTWIGTEEIKGIKHNPKVVGIWSAIGMPWFKDDETPWCAGALTLWLKQSGVCLPQPKNAAAALSYLNYGTKLVKPAYGSIAVKRRKGGGHVGIVVGRFADGRLAILGANQDDRVSIAPYRTSDFETFRWPTGKVPHEFRYDLPLLGAGGAPVKSEG